MSSARLLHRIGAMQFRSFGDLHGSPCPDHPHLRQRQLPLHRAVGPSAGHLGHDARAGGLLLHLQGQVAPLECLRGPGEPGIHHRCSRALRIPRVERLGGHRWRGLGRSPRRPGHRWASGVMAAHPGGRRLDGSAVVHDGELRQPPRHHELRLRRALVGAASAQPRARHGREAPRRHPHVRAPVGLRGADELGRRTFGRGAGRSPSTAT